MDMSEVSSVEGIRYGLGMIAYITAISIFGGLFFIIGIVLVSERELAIGSISTLIGFVVLYAGFVGTTYKIIADGVARGNQATAVAPSATKKPTSDSQNRSTTTAKKVEEE